MAALIDDLAPGDGRTSTSSVEPRFGACRRAFERLLFRAFRVFAKNCRASVGIVSSFGLDSDKGAKTLIGLSFVGSHSQLLSHEVMLVSCWMVLKGSKDAISESFVKWSCLKTEGIEECIGAATLDSIKFRTPH
jgi:hypothetical protein